MESQVFIAALGGRKKPRCACKQLPKKEDATWIICKKPQRNIGAPTIIRT